ncbi:hypothetical protein PVAP13_9KG229400 [Panicum virgatum]|uniref:Zinc finger GRF-type domain-containing protein n=1 Tax=Panicum virgatum TaxID=38727 RepID=A0A8T0NJM1_PANVG|nr:hypothetical protein PVAP13_9KG229400 [Panicum virgatum]
MVVARQGPLYYWPPVLCKCGNKAVWWTSWSDENPSQRFLNCFCDMSTRGVCNFWRWIDPPPSPFMQELLVDLRDTIRALKRENRELERSSVLDVAEDQRGLVDAIGAQMVAVVTTKDEENSELRCSINSLEKGIWMFKFLMVTCVVVVLVMAWVNWK